MSWLKAMREKEPPEPVNPIGIIVIGTLEPDIMDNPKEMVRKSLKNAQFKTVDLGKNVSVKNFVSKAKEVNADIIVVTIGYTPAKENLPNLASEIKSQGLEGKVAVLIGGAAVKKEDAEKINALFGETREEAVALAKKIIEKKNLKPN